MARRKYTQEEEQIIFEEISNSIHNIQQGCKNAAERLGRTPHAIEQHWYNVTSKSEACYFIAGRGNKAKNRKVVRVDTYDSRSNNSPSLWDKLLRLFGIR